MSESRQRVLVLCFSDLSRDARVRRQVALLARRFTVCATAFGDPCMEGVEFVPVPPPDMSFIGKVAWALKLKLGSTRMAYDHLASVRAARVALAGRCFALIIANDVATLPLARDLAGACRAKVIFDAHEFSPLEFEEDAKWRFFLESWTARLCCEHVPRVDGMMTVSEGIAERWQREYGVNPVVVPNAPPYHDMAVPERIGRPLRLVHHGVALRIRKIETLIDAALSWPDCELDLYLVANDRQLVEELRSRASGCSRIRILPPVPVERIVPTLGSYDVGVCAFTYQPAGFNTVQSLPNKFFDFIQARLAVCIGPLPEMAKWTTRYHLGVVARGFEAADLVDALKMLSDEDLLAMRRASAVAARDLCWEFFSSRLDALVDQVLGT